MTRRSESSTGASDTRVTAVDVVALATGVRVHIGGRLDAHSVAHVREILHRVIDEGVGPVLIELPDAEIGDATALGLLVGAHHRARRQGRELYVGEVSERTARLLRMSHLDRVLAQGREATRTVAALTA
jgi:anti-anti-sigma factor